jgi:hypothetical protein
MMVYLLKLGKGNDRMKTKIVRYEPIINTTPLHQILIGESGPIIEFDDINEIRWRLKFKTIQAWRITHEQCFDRNIILVEEAFINGIYQKYLLEVENSSWLDKLKEIQEHQNPEESYMNKAHHYILLLGEHVVEVIAWDNYTLEIIK